MRILTSSGYYIVLEEVSDLGIYKYISDDGFNWDAFYQGDLVYVETPDGEYTYKIDHINYVTRLVVLVQRNK